MLPKDLFLDFYRSNEEQLGIRVAAKNMAACRMEHSREAGD